jgi:peptide/nickel transport system permease protein
MLRYILRRLFIAIPTLLIISLAVFGLSKCAPGDPVEVVFGAENSLLTHPDQAEANYRRDASELGLYKPLFYFSLTTQAEPDTLWKICPADRRQRLGLIVAQNGNWEATRAYEQAVKQCLRLTEGLSDTVAQKPFFRLAVYELFTTYQLEKIPSQVQAVKAIFLKFPHPTQGLTAAIDDLEKTSLSVWKERKPANLWIPAIHWNGFNNQYHHWLSGFVTGNWGLTKNRLPLWKELKPALFATMAVNLLAILFAYLISIPLGVEMARRKGKALDRWVQRTLVFIHAMPVFWLGGLLIMLVSSPIWGPPLLANPYLDVSDAWNMNSQSFLDWFSQKLPKFVMPIFVLTVYSLAILTLQMRGGMIETLGQDYIRTARAKGVNEEEVYWLHAFRNALFPIITIFASVFPAMFTGSLVIETLFNFPGMGLKATKAFADHDLTILSAILMAAALFTILGNLVADLLYAWVDPRVKFAKEG